MRKLFLIGTALAVAAGITATVTRAETPTELNFGVISTEASVNQKKNCIKKVKMQDSKGNNLLQLADMVAGAINRSLHGLRENSLYREIIKSREIYVQSWPK